MYFLRFLRWSAPVGPPRGSRERIASSVHPFGREFLSDHGIAGWQVGVHVVGRTLSYFQAVHQEADVVSENVDAIRAMLKLEKDGRRSIAKTDKSLGIGA